MTYFTIWCGLNFSVSRYGHSIHSLDIFIEIADYPYRKKRLTLRGSHTLLEFVIPPR